MRVLQENNINLEKVASELGFTVESLTELDNEGETKLFNDVTECFEWMFIDGYKNVENIRPYMLQMANLKHTDFTGTVAELMVGEQCTFTLDDGRVVFVYQ